METTANTEPQANTNQAQNNSNLDQGQNNIPDNSLLSGDQNNSQASQAPENYTDFTLPEGMQLDPGLSQQFTGIARELNLTQEQAQKLIDLQVGYVKNQSDSTMNQYNQTVESWKNETIQSLGADYKTQLGVAAKALDQFGTPELRSLLNDTGLGNHKEVVNFFLKVGKFISEDNFAGQGGSQNNAEKSMAEILYPSMKKGG